MNNVPKKTRRLINRWLLLAAAIFVLLAAGAAYLLLETSTPPVTPDSAVTYGELYVHDQSEIQSLTVTQRNREPWTLTVDDSGAYRLLGHESWTLDDALVRSLTMVASVVSYEKILTDDPADYAGHLADFGLETPRLTVSVTYSDGTSVTMHIGDQVTGTDMAHVYMLIEGDDRLFALDKGTFDSLNIEASLLHTVPQPVIHKARIDAITLTGASGEIANVWALQGSITDADAAAQWLLTVPRVYPADTDVIDSLRENLSTLRLGSYICDATPEALAEYGFTQPRFIIEVHQAEGTTNDINANGEIEFVTWPESTFTLTVGNEKNANVDYVLVDGSIYTASHFILEVFMDLTYLETLSRYPVTVATSVLSEFSITNGGQTDVYRLTRETEIVDEQTGELASVTSVTLNGQEISYSAFEAAYIRLETVRISGLLPTGWTPAEDPHTTFTFVSTSGLTQTIALSTFDAMHDAVIVNGHAVFYLIKNGMEFTFSANE